MKPALVFRVLWVWLLSLQLACYVAPESAPPASFTQAETAPDRPTDTTQPLSAVIWMLNYDVRQFDTVWAWLHSDVPAGAERSRAIGAAGLVAVAELDRYEMLDEAVSAFDEAIPAFPTDARLPTWRSYLRYLKARIAGDSDGVTASFTDIRAATADYQSFTMFGLTLAAAGWADAPPELLAEADQGFQTVTDDTARMQMLSHPNDLERSRRIWDTPIAPYNIPAMQAMIGDLKVRIGQKDQAPRGYYTALHANNAYRWPWRAEVMRRLQDLDGLESGLAARPATETMLGSTGIGALGVSSPRSDPRFGGRIGNGSCTICHTHVSAYDLNEEPDAVGWVRGRAAPMQGVPNPQPIAFLLPDGKNPTPGGFGIGPFVDATAPRDFYTDNSLYDGTFFFPAPAGRYFVALQTSINNVTYQGYSSREFGTQWFIDIKAGEVVDLPYAITLAPQQ